MIDDATVTPTWHEDTRDRNLVRYQWCRSFREIARIALKRGWRLLVPVPRDEIAFATAEIVKALNLPAYVWHTRRHESLIVGLMEEDREEEDEETNGHGEQT